MPVLFQVHDVSKRYGDRYVLKDASASFSSDQKIGMIGRNGAGKSTLCRIICGLEEMDSGTITKNSALRLSYLEQHDAFALDETVIAFLVRYTDREEWECGEMAARFHIKHTMLDFKMGALSGGYRTRVKLAAMLLKDPNFLILDEPTNYLDLTTLILLENFLKEFKGGYLIVSHDREFLKRTCTSTLEVEQSGLTFYPGAIEEYFEFKEEQLQNKIAYNKGVEKKREQLQEFVDRFKARASTATRAKSKMKQIEKLETIEIQHALSTVNIRIPPVEKKAGVALSSSDLVVGYPDKVVAKGISLEIERGQHVAILGDNGQGKTTFLRTVAGDLTALGGSYKWGTGLKVAYYAQHVFSSLHPESDVYGHLSGMSADGVSNQDILDMAGCFLFKGDDVRKKIAVLSGGERARLVLAGLLLTKSHILLLDEPTNHLDFETVEALGNALHGYNGTVFFISHDRTFVHQVATQILEVRNGKIMKYPGLYDDYVYFLEKRAEETFDPYNDNIDEDDWTKAKNLPKAPGGQAAPQAKDGGPAADDKETKKKILELKEKVKKLEKKTASLKKEKDDLTHQMAENPFFNSKERGQKLKELEEAVREAENEWILLHEKLEKLEKSGG